MTYDDYLSRMERLQTEITCNIARQVCKFAQTIDCFSLTDRIGELRRPRMSSTWCVVKARSQTTW